MNRIAQISSTPADLLAMIEDLLHRARTGTVLGLALVEHRPGDEVCIEWCGPRSYHQLNSGAARLAHRLAAQESE